MAALDHHHSFYVLSVVLLFCPCLSAADHACLMPPKVSPAARLQRARERGSESDRDGIDDTIVPGKIVPSTEKSYDDMIDVFNA